MAGLRARPPFRLRWIRAGSRGRNRRAAVLEPRVRHPPRNLRPSGRAAAGRRSPGQNTCLFIVVKGRTLARNGLRLACRARTQEEPAGIYLGKGNGTQAGATAISILYDL